MEELLSKLKKDLQMKLESAKKEADILNIKSEYVGKKSEISSILASLKDMSIEDKKKYGSLINNTKKENAANTVGKGTYTFEPAFRFINF